VIDMPLCLRFKDHEKKLIEKYAQMHNMSASAFIRESVLERIEDEYDCKMFEQALEEFKKDPTTYTHEEIWKRLETC
jgi:uncharacterized protein (DUF1778 family)